MIKDSRLMVPSSWWPVLELERSQKGHVHALIFPTLPHEPHAPIVRLVDEEVHVEVT